jgi:integrase
MVDRNNPTKIATPGGVERDGRTAATQGITRHKRRRQGRSMKLPATVKEAVADAQVEISQEENAETRPGAPGPRTDQDGGAEQPHIRQRPANLRPRHSRFVAWYCSEPRLAFNRTVVLRYRIHLEQRGYAPATTNLRLAAVRRVAYEAADAGLLSPELAAGIRRVKGVRRIGVRLGNWLTPEQGRRLLECTTPSTLRELRNHAMVAMLIGCGLRRGELLALRLDSIQQREEHWVIADLVGKGGHVRTVPIPAWVKAAVDAWTAVAAITNGPVFRAINKAGRVWGDGMSPKVLWDVVRAAAARASIDKLAPHDLRRTCARLCHLAGGELDQIQFLLGHVSIQRRSATSDANRSSVLPSTTGWESNPTPLNQHSCQGGSFKPPWATTQE